MAEREDLDDINGELIERLKVFCECFVKYFEKELNEIEAVGGTHEIGKMNCIKFESLIGSTKFSTNHSSILIDDGLRSIKDDKDFRELLASAAGEIFWCFQNQFMLITDGMETLAFDGVSRLFDYISSTKNRKININTFCDFITEGTILGKSKTGHMIKYQNNLYQTSELYEDVGILESKKDESKKYYNSTGSSCKFSYRFSFSWDTFNEFSVKTYASGEEPIIYCGLTKNMLNEQLRNILRIINGEDIVDHSMLLVSDAATNSNYRKRTFQNIYRDTPQVKPDNKIIKNEATNNDQHKTKPVWFDMRKPVETFTGRIDVLEKLYKALHYDTGSAVISQTISGLGGIGKSELARKYAYEFHKGYDNVIWINSEKYDSLKLSFHRLAERLDIPTTKNDKERTIASIIADIYTRFGHEKCLFIFDNAEDYKIIKEFLPLSLSPTIKRPHILLTSRSQNWQLPDAKQMTVINLEYFTEEEAINYIKVALTNSTEESLIDEEIKNLVIELGYFPLALGQAVAYIKKKHVTINDYIKLYQDKKPKLLAHRHKLSTYNETILTTWNITLNKIEHEDKNAIEIIEIMSYLVPDSINADRMFKELIKDEEKRQDAIKLLLNYSMINNKDQVLSIHRLVQEVIRLQVKGKGKETDVLKNALELLGFDLDSVDEIHLISVWSYACDYGEIIDQFFFQYKRYDKKLTPFHLIVESGNIDAVNKILNHLKKKSNKKFKEILNFAKYPYNETPLDISIRQNNLEMVKLLSEFGAEKNNKICVKTIIDGRVDLVKYFYPNNDEYLLHAKFYSALKSENVASVNNLLKDLKNEQIKNLMEQKLLNLDPKLFIYEFPPLYLAAQSGNLEIVKLLVINYGADINFSCKWGTSLHAAVDKGHLEIMKLLIKNGANCNAVNSYGRTVLHSAASYGRLEIVKYLIENNKCNINATDKRGLTALELATQSNELEVVKYLMKILNERKLI